MTARAPADARPSHDGTRLAPDGQRVSRTGAALGRPEMEHDQYGLTRPAPGGGLLPEREVRGVRSPAVPKPRD